VTPPPNPKGTPPHPKGAPAAHAKGAPAPKHKEAGVQHKEHTLTTKKGKTGPNEDMRFAEAQQLSKAYVLLAGSNHDYNGHRVKAMHAVHGAFKMLDAHIMKHGTALQKEVTLQERAAIALAEQAAKRTPMLHERQAAADLQLREAREILAQIRPGLAQFKQNNLLGHVDNAVNQIRIALAIR
jgi:hypothetical protein